MLMKVEKEKTEEEKMIAGLDAIAGLLLLAPFMLWQGFACAKVWAWFVASSMQWPVIPTLVWVGILTVYSIFKINGKKPDAGLVIPMLLRASFATGFLFVIAWIVHAIAR